MPTEAAGVLESREVIAAILGGLIGVAGTVIAAVLVEVYRRRVRRKDQARLESALATGQERNRIALYYTTMADALQGMVEEFSRRRIPHMFGNLFSGIQISLLSYYSGSIMTEQDKDMLREAQQMQQEALRYDGQLYNDTGVTDGQIDGWRTDAEHLMARLRTRAIEIQGTPGRL